MATILSDLALRLYAQTSELKKGLNEASASTKNFQKTTSKSGKAAGKSFSTMSKTAGGALAQMTGGLGAIPGAAGGAVSGFKAMAVGATTLNVALGPIGIIIGVIALAVAAMMAYFKGSVDGAEKFAGIMGVLKGVLAAFKDIIIGVGRALVNAFENPKQAIADLWAFLKKNLINRFEGMKEFFIATFRVLELGFQALGQAIKGMFDKDARKESKALFAEMQQEIIKTGKAAVKMATGFEVEDIINKGKKVLEEVAAKANIIKNIEKARFALMFKNMQVALMESKERRTMAKLLLKTRDYTNASNQERIDALGQLEKKELAISNAKIDAAKQAVSLQKEENAATETSVEDAKKLNELEITLNNMYKTRDDKLREIENRNNEMASSTAKYIKAGIVGWEKMTRVEADAAVELQTLTASAGKYVDEIIKANTEAQNDMTFEGRLANLQAAMAEEKSMLEKAATDAQGRALLTEQQIVDGKKAIEQSYLRDKAAITKENNEEIAENELEVARATADAIKTRWDDVLGAQNDGVAGLVGAWGLFFDEIKGKSSESAAVLTELVASTGQAIADVSASIIGTLGDIFEAQKNKELEAAGDNAAAREKIEKKYAKKQQKLAVAQALISTALAVASALTTQPFIPMGLIAAVIAGAAGAAQVAAIKSQSFAQGAIVSGPTLGLVGEYPGARSNPEVIAPLDKLQNLLQPVGQNVVFTIEYDKLVGVLDNGSQITSAY